MQLDYQVDVALEEIEWQRDPDSAHDEEIERPSAERLAWAMSGIRDNFNLDCMGEDLKVVHEFLEQPALFAPPVTGDQS